MSILATYMVPHPPIIIPEIGKGEESKISHTIEAYKVIAKEIAHLKPETIIVTTPHSTLYSDYFHISPGKEASGDFAKFGAKQVAIKVTYDTEFVNSLCANLEERNMMAGTMGERNRSLDHGTLIPLYFINQYYNNYKLIRIGLSGQAFLEHYRLGMAIQYTANQLQRRTIVIGSGDLSHCLKEDGPYGFRKEGMEYDDKIMKVMAKGDFLDLFQFNEVFCEKASECGHRSFLIMAGTLNRMKVRPKILSYEGPFGVGYGICSYLPEEEDEERDFANIIEKEKVEFIREKRAKEDAYVKLARTALESFLLSGKINTSNDSIPSEMLEQKAGAFVSLKKDGKLRGCIGTILPTRDTLAEEIRMNAISAATHDPRFKPVTKEELDELIVSVDVLGLPEKITSTKELDPLRYGVIVTKGSKRGLLLPNLEGVDTVEQQILIAKQKAGIGANEEVKLERFEVIRHE